MLRLASGWSDVGALWHRCRRTYHRFDDTRLLLLLAGDKPPKYSILPTEPLNSELRQFIEDKVREHGGDVA